MPLPPVYLMPPPPAPRPAPSLRSLIRPMLGAGAALALIIGGLVAFPFSYPDADPLRQGPAGLSYPVVQKPIDPRWLTPIPTPTPTR